MQPKNMPDWLYKYFADVIHPLIYEKDGHSLAKPGLFTDSKPYSPASFWVHPPEPAISLSLHRFDPPALYQPRVFLWLPHFFVETLHCPCCRTPLDKNGALCPHCIVDVDHCFYIVTWAYYCHKGCRAYFHGWSQALLNLFLLGCIFLFQQPFLIKVVSLAMCSASFVLVISTRWVLVVFTHCCFKCTLCVSTPFRLNTQKHCLNKSMANRLLIPIPSNKICTHILPIMSPALAIFVLTADYLADMINKAIELEEPDADKHTSCLAPDQLAIDDSHKVSFNLQVIGY